MTIVKDLSQLPAITTHIQKLRPLTPNIRRHHIHKTLLDLLLKHPEQKTCNWQLSNNTLVWINSSQLHVTISITYKKKGNQLAKEFPKCVKSKINAFKNHSEDMVKWKFALRKLRHFVTFKKGKHSTVRKCVIDTRVTNYFCFDKFLPNEQ